MWMMDSSALSLINGEDTSVNLQVSAVQTTRKQEMLTCAVSGVIRADYIRVVVHVSLFLVVGLSRHFNNPTNRFFLFTDSVCLEISLFLFTVLCVLFSYVQFLY